MNAISTEFKPIKLNGITRREKIEIEFIRKTYKEICDKLTDIKFALENILTDFEDSSDSLTMDFIKSKDRLLFVKTKFVQLKKVSIPGLKLDALVQSNLLDIPTDQLGFLMKSQGEFNILHSNVRPVFDYDLAKLYLAEDTVFLLSDEFEHELQEKYTNYTSTIEENQTVEAMQGFVDSVNKLMQMELIRNDMRWILDVRFNEQVLIFDYNSDTPLRLNRSLIKRLPKRRTIK